MGVNINDIKGADDALTYILDNPTEFIEAIAADAKAAGDTALQDRVFTVLKGGILDTRCRRDRGYSIWEPIFADLDRRYPTSEDKRLWERNRWPFYFDRLRNSGLWVPCDMNGGVLYDQERARHFDKTEQVGSAWFFPCDPRSFGLRSQGGIWHKMYDTRLYLSGAYDGNGDYFVGLGRLIGSLDPRHASELAWWLLRREPWRTGKAAA